MGVAAAPSGPASESDRTGPGRAHWLRVAGEAADDLATDAVAREQAGKAPFDEVSRLREAGLLTLLIPAELGEAARTGPRPMPLSGRSPRPTARSVNCSAVTTSCRGAPDSSPSPLSPRRSSGSPRRSSGAGVAVSPVRNRL